MRMLDIRPGRVGSQGSRSLYMRLESGDTISLRTGNVGFGLYQISLCFELAQSDYSTGNVITG